MDIFPQWYRAAIAVNYNTFVGIGTFVAAARNTVVFTWNFHHPVSGILWRGCEISCRWNEENSEYQQ